MGMQKVFSNQVEGLDKGIHCPEITHLAFADDITNFTNSSRASLSKLMAFLGQYEVESDHLISKQKSCFVVGEMAAS